MCPIALCSCVQLRSNVMVVGVMKLQAITYFHIQMYPYKYVCSTLRKDWTLVSAFFHILRSKTCIDVSAFVPLCRIQCCAAFKWNVSLDKQPESGILAVLGVGASVAAMPVVLHLCSNQKKRIRSRQFVYQLKPNVSHSDSQGTQTTLSLHWCVNNIMSCILSIWHTIFFWSSAILPWTPSAVREQNAITLSSLATHIICISEKSQASGTSARASGGQHSA